MDIFATAVLAKIVERLERPRSFLLDMFFPMVQTEPGSEEIHFDIDDGKPRIAPFVSPLVAGKVQIDDGFTTKSFKPAYVKDKRRFNPGQPLKRQMGEQIGGSLSPQQRREMALAQRMMDQLERLTVREEVMAAEALKAGQVTVAGEQYPTKVVDFGRDGGLTVTLAGGSQWGDAGVKPVDDLESWADDVQTASGGIATQVVMDPLAWKLFRADADVKSLLDTRRGSGSTAETGPLADRRGRYVGQIGQFDIWVYQDTYVDEAGNTQKVMADNSVILGDQQAIEGTRCYAAIQDEEAGYEALRYFAKSWLEKDPAIRYLLLQSAPLVVPYRPNASLYAKVK